MKTGVFIGRFQPFHDGHRHCVEKILAECDRCVVIIRDTPETAKNPFDVAVRERGIREHFPDEDKVKIITIPDEGAEMSVFIGRDVGYELIQLDESVEKISATDVRRKLYEEAGKTYNPDAPRRVR